MITDWEFENTKPKLVNAICSRFNEVIMPVRRYTMIILQLSVFRCISAADMNRHFFIRTLTIQQFMGIRAYVSSKGFWYADKEKLIIMNSMSKDVICQALFE